MDDTLLDTERDNDLIKIIVAADAALKDFGTRLNMLATAEVEETKALFSDRVSDAIGPVNALKDFCNG